MIMPIITIIAVLVLILAVLDWHRLYHRQKKISTRWEETSTSWKKTATRWEGLYNQPCPYCHRTPPQPLPESMELH